MSATVGATRISSASLSESRPQNRRCNTGASHMRCPPVMQYVRTWLKKREWRKPVRVNAVAERVNARTSECKHGLVIVGVGGFARLLPVRESYQIALIPLDGFAQQLADRVAQILHAIRLAQKWNVHCRRFIGRGQSAREKDWQSGITLTQSMSESQPVHGAGHRDVAEDEIEFLATLQHLQRGCGIVGQDIFVTELIDERGCDLGNFGIVFYDKHSAVRKACKRAVLVRSNDNLRRRRTRQVHRDFGSLTDVALR